MITLHYFLDTAMTMVSISFWRHITLISFLSLNNHFTSKPVFVIIDVYFCIENSPNCSRLNLCHTKFGSTPESRPPPSSFIICIITVSNTVKAELSKNDYWKNSNPHFFLFLLTSIITFELSELLEYVYFIGKFMPLCLFFQK